MNVVEVAEVSKSFGETKVVDELSFSVGPGEILGLVGPNGAGKTTTIRMLMDIVRPDAGEIRILGSRLDDATRNRVAYLPEERGLYRKLRVAETITYLAALKGVSASVAKERSVPLLQRVDMLQHRHKRIEELSRGMGQLIQFVVTILHDPALIVLDEPFSGMDPVNTELVKEMVLELRGQGKTIILSTHMMNQVEELCDRVLMIDRGRAVLYGTLGEIRARYRSKSVVLEGDCLPETLPGVVGRREHGRRVELYLDSLTSPQDVLRALVEANTVLERFELSTPSLNEIFIRVVQEGR